MRTATPAEERVLAMVEPVADALGLRIVRIRIQGLKRKTLQIMAERRADGQMGLEDCERLSRALNPVFEETDPLPGEYALEISSPGIDRPLIEAEDFARFVGHEAKIETAQMIDGRKRFRGDLLGLDGSEVRLALPEGEVRLPLAAIATARLVLTDRLIEEDLRRAKAAEAADRAASDDTEGDPPQPKSAPKKRTKPQ